MKRYLWRDRHGRPRVRVRGRTYPLRDENGAWHEPDTPEGDRIYWEILRGKRASTRTWNALIQSFMESDRWAGLKPRTRKDYERVFYYLREKIGDRDVAPLIRRDVIEAQKANAHRTRFANYIPQVMSVLCEHAIDLGWRQTNPAKGAKPLPVPEDRKRAHVPWTDPAVKTWRAEARPIPRLIFEIGVGSVQRPDDWTRFRWSDYDGEALRVKQSKTDADLWLPCTAMLKAALDSAPKKGLTILTRPDGTPMNYHYMARVMRAERERLGLLAHDLHALRYRGVMELAWAGCDDDEIAAYSGHTSKEMIRKYAGKARQMMRARQAWEKRR